MPDVAIPWTHKQTFGDREPARTLVRDDIFT